MHLMTLALNLLYYIRIICRDRLIVAAVDLTGLQIEIGHLSAGWFCCMTCVAGGRSCCAGAGLHLDLRVIQPVFQHGELSEHLPLS